jgi:hypothetical protein
MGSRPAAKSQYFKSGDSNAWQYIKRILLLFLGSYVKIYTLEVNCLQNCTLPYRLWYTIHIINIILNISLYQKHPWGSRVIIWQGRISENINNLGLCFERVEYFLIQSSLNAVYIRMIIPFLFWALWSGITPPAPKLYMYIYMNSPFRELFWTMKLH